MHFLLAPVGSFGDVSPYLAIGEQLRRRGHRVTVMSNVQFSAMVRQSGLEFVPLGTEVEYAEFYDNPDSWHWCRSWKLALTWGALRPMRRLYSIIAERYQPGETVVVAPGMAFGARIAQERLGVPTATIHLEPDKFRSLVATPVMPPPLVLSDWVPRISKRAQLWIADNLVVDRFIGPEVNLFRAELGLAPTRGFVASWWHSPDLVVGMFPAWYCRPQADWPGQTVLVGFPLADHGEAMAVPSDAMEFLDSGSPPVVFTPGTSNIHARQFFASAAEACRRLGLRGMLMTSHAEQLPSSLPRGVRHFAYCPFRYLLPRAAALVHHAGIGSTAHALAAGIPQVVMPMTFSQPDDAARLVRLGVAASLRPGAFTGAALTRALGCLLHSSATREKCRQFAANFRHARPIEDTCDMLEALGHSRRCVMRRERPAPVADVVEDSQ